MYIIISSIWLFVLIFFNIQLSKIYYKVIAYLQATIIYDSKVLCRGYNIKRFINKATYTSTWVDIQNILHSLQNSCQVNGKTQTSYINNFNLGDIKALM